MEDHVFFTVKKIGFKYCAIRYTPRPTPGYGGKLVFNMAFDVLIAGQSLADKETSLQMIADTLNEAVARDAGTEAKKP